MNENNDKEEKPKARVERLLEILKKLVDIKSAVRGAKRSLRRCKRKDRVAEKLEARVAADAFKANEAKKELDAITEKYANDTSKEAAAAISAAKERIKVIEEDCDKAKRVAEFIRSLDEGRCESRLSSLLAERGALRKSAIKLLGEIGGFRRKDRKEVIRLRKLCGV